MKPEFKTYQEQVLKNAKVLAESLMDAGFQLVSGGTDNHLMLVDLRPANITGKEMEKRLDQVNITVNKNTIPDDPQSPFVTSGIRVGVPAGHQPRSAGGGHEGHRPAHLEDRHRV